MTKARIMHIDDEADIREIVRLSLSRDPGLEVRSFATGPEGVDAVVDWQPDLFLLDFMMPKVDGVATLAMLRETEGATETPVVFMTGRAQPRDVEVLMSLGAVAVLSKPFGALTLAGTLRNHLISTPLRHVE